MTQTQLAEKIGTNKTYISKIENGLLAAREIGLKEGLEVSSGVSLNIFGRKYWNYGISIITLAMM